MTLIEEVRKGQTNNAPTCRDAARVRGVDLLCAGLTDAYARMEQWDQKRWENDCVKLCFTLQNKSTRCFKVVDALIGSPF